MNVALQAQATAAVIASATGTNPIVSNRGDNIYDITPRSEDVPAIQNQLRDLLNTKREPSPVRVNYQAAVLPVLAEKYGAALFFGGVAIMYLGYTLKRR